MSSRSTPQTEDAQTEREPVHLRSHETYQQDHWQTAHLEAVDCLGVFESASEDDLRIDVDGEGAGLASLHDAGDNLQVSIWFDVADALDLRDDLNDGLDDVREFPEDLDEETTRFFERMIGPFECLNCGTEFRIESVHHSASAYGDSVHCPVCESDSVGRTDGGRR